jgi:hypothetical protein
MGVFYTLLILITGYLVVLPIYKKRPVLIRVFNLWFVYGITGTMLTEALEKASTATRTEFVGQTNNYKINSSSNVDIVSFAGKISFVYFRNITNSKKAKLTIKVFRKFILNYFV